MSARSPGSSASETAELPESQDFMGGGLRRPLQGEAPPPATSWTNPAQVLGRHRGIIHYTIGQRRGLGVAAGKPRLRQGHRRRAQLDHRGA